MGTMLSRASLELRSEKARLGSSLSRLQAFASRCVNERRSLFLFFPIVSFLPVRDFRSDSPYIELFLHLLEVSLIKVVRFSILLMFV
jgi:hypothetical protein